MRADVIQLTEPPCRDLQFRIEMTSACRDCEDIPKVAKAGQVVIVGGKSVQIMHNGVMVTVGGYYGDWMVEIIRRLRGHHEPQEELVFHEVLKHLDSATMIEIGGYWSYYSLWFLHQHPGRRAIVVEPDPSHLAVGQANARLNERQIEFIQASVGGQSLADHEFMTETVGAIRIPQVTVGQILKDRSIEYLDVLHCDAQGAEIEILASSMELLANRRIRFCVISTHSHHITGDPLTHQRCLALVRQAGGQILAEHDVNESFSGDGLIVAYFGASLLPWQFLPVSYNRYSKSLFRNPLFDLAEARQT